jgi:hypothetical protein
MDLIMRQIRGPVYRPCSHGLFVQPVNEALMITLTSLPCYQTAHEDDKTSIPIWPDRGPMREWSLTELLIFVNEFGKSWVIHDCPRTYPFSGDRPAYCQFTFDSSKSDKYQTVRIAIPAKGYRISVDASCSWLEKKWTKEIIPVELRVGNVDSSRHLGYYRYVKTKAVKQQTSKCLLFGNAIVAGGAEAVTLPFRTIVARLARVPACMRVPKKEFVIQLYQILTDSPSNRVTCNLDTLKARGGYFTIGIQLRHRLDKMERYVIDGTEYSITQGCYVHPLAASILQHRDANGIAGLMTDTIWSVIRLYVTAFDVQ